MIRRHFLRRSAAVSATLVTAPSLWALEMDNAYRRNIGLQLYTVRDAIAKDPAAALKAVAAAGYKQGEMYGFPDCDPMIAAAKDAGLALHSSHFQWDSVVKPSDEGMSDFKKIVEKAHKTGLRHLVIPYLQEEHRGSVAVFQKVAAHANKAAAIARDAGLQLSYHNHSFEFKPLDGGRTGFDVFMEEFSPDMKFELDLFWVKVGGKDPADMLKKLTGRVTQVHLKDLKPGMELPNYGSVPPDAFKELGNGIIPTEPLMLAAKAAGVEHAHVEQDQSPDPMKSIAQSLAYLRTL